MVEEVKNNIIPEQAVTDSQKMDELKVDKNKFNFKTLIDGSLLTREIILKQIVYVLFVVLLCVFYIANKYKAEKLFRQTQALQKEIRELKTEQMSVTSELMQLSQQSEVSKMVANSQIGIKESIEPPKVILNKANTNDAN